MPEGGFAIRRGLTPDLDVDASATPWLTAKGSSRTVIKTVRSLTETRRMFEDLGRDPTQERAMTFATRFGWLSHPRLLFSLRHDSKARVAYAGGLFGEDVGELYLESSRYVWLRGLWSTINALELATRHDTNGTGALRKLGASIRHSDGGWEYWRAIRGGGGTEALWARIDDPAVVRLLPRTDPIPAARYVLSHEINTGLRGHVDVTLMPFRHGAMRLVPDCLLAALYVGFANEVSSGLRSPSPHQCPVDGRSFEGRKNQIYCSTSCKERKKYLVSAGRWEDPA
jgi:hypothetical protein